MESCWIHQVDLNAVSLLARLWRQQPSKELVGIFAKALAVHGDAELASVLLEPTVLRDGELDLHAVVDLVISNPGSLRSRPRGQVPRFSVTASVYQRSIMSVACWSFRGWEPRAL